MNKSIENRRDFLKRASLVAASFPLLLNCKSDSLAQKSGESVLSLIKKNALRAEGAGEWNGAKDAPADVSWKTALPKKSDKDEAMIVSGTVYQPDGKTPAPDVLIYFYHTDREGNYGKRGEVWHGHFRGWLLTGADGKYEFSSIKPAPYPNRNQAAHIHFTLTGKNFREDWIDSILFEGDKFTTGEEKDQAGKRGGFNPILKLERGADGILRGVRNIQLETI